MTTYTEVRSHIKTGDLLAWSGGSWKNWHDIQVSLVRMFTRSEFSHVGVAYVVHDRIFILESVGTGVRMFPLSRELPFYWVKRKRKLSQAALEWAFAHIGAEYESKLMMVWSFITGATLDKNERLQCSEYVLGIYRADNEVLTSIAEPTAIVRAAMRCWGPLEFVS